MSSTGETHTGETKPPEASDVPLRGVLWFVAIFIAFAIVTHIGVWFLYRAFVASDAKMDLQNSGVVTARPAPPEPQLQPSVTHNVFPKQDLILLRQRENAEFAKRGWLNEKGEFAIPAAIVEQVATVSSTQPSGAKH